MKLTFSLLFFVIYLISNGQNPQIEELGKLYMSGNFNQTIIKAKEYLSDDKDNIDYKLILGRALADNRDFKASIPILKSTAENDTENSWRKAWSLGYLGSCYFMISDYKNSEQAIKDCINLNATKNATNYSYKRLLLFGYDDFFKDWDIIESDNFRFHFQKISDSEKEYYINSREKAFQQINDFFKCDIPKKIDFFVWNSREDATKILHTNLGFADPQYCIIHSHYQQTKGHEMTHVISNYLSENISKTGLINEGTSVCFDLTNQNKEELIKSWLEKHDEKVNIKDVWSNWKKYPNEFSYPLSGVFVGELIDKFGKEKFLSFFIDQTYENAKNIFGNELDIMIEDFEKKFN